MFFVNENLKNIKLDGGIYDLYQKALYLESIGKRVVHMEIGRPDFYSPKFANQAAIDAIKAGKVHYTAMSGIPELREAICNMEYEKNRIIANPQNEIVVTCGACEALMSVMMATLTVGDAILVPGPYFGAYANMAAILGVDIIEVPCKASDDFILKADNLISCYTDKVKIILLNTPNNPTGAIIKDEELKKIADFAKKKRLLVISDETYSQFLYEGKHVSISTINSMKNQTVVISSASKVFSMTGWRIGYAILPSDLMPYVNKVHENLSTCATSFAQYGAAKAYKFEDNFTKNMVEEFKNRRDILFDSLSECDNIRPVKPKGAFYMMVDISKTGLSSKDFSDKLLDEKGIAVTPGTAFGNSGDGFIRISFGCSLDDINYAVKQIKEFI